MAQENLLLDIFYYLGATVLFVPITQALRLGSVLGYLLAGIVLGPSCLGLLVKSGNIQEISQFGIILLLFVVGLELTPKRLQALNRYIFRDGFIQMGLTSLLFIGIGKMLGLELVPNLVIAFALSLSSTAFSLYYLKDTNQLETSYGKSSLGILLFQDLIIIPLLVLLPYLANGAAMIGDVNSTSLAKSIGIISVCLFVGKFCLRPLLSLINRTQPKEIFIGCSFMLIIGLSLLMDMAGLSKGLGAFLAGVFLAGSTLQKEIQNFTLPIKTMLMGVFFMGFGLSFNLNYFSENIYLVSGVTLGFMLCKFLVLTTIGRVSTGTWKSGYKMGLFLCQGGEFGLLILSSALGLGVLSMEQESLMMSSLFLSMFLAPFVVKFTGNTNEVLVDTAEVIMINRNEEIAQAQEESAKSETDIAA